MKESKPTKCKACGHPRTHHSREGCLNNGMCDKGCKIIYMEKEMFE